MTHLLLTPSKGTVQVPVCTPAFMRNGRQYGRVYNGQLIGWEKLPNYHITSNGFNNLMNFIKVKPIPWNEDSHTLIEIFEERIKGIQNAIRDVLYDIHEYNKLDAAQQKSLMGILALTSHCLAFQCSLRITENTDAH